MTLLPDFYTVERMTSPAEGVHRVEIHLNPTHPVFAGHFPNNPVAPGVCMMQIVKELTETIVEKKLFLIQASNVKFTALINPHETPVLQAEFEISYDDEGHVKVRNTITFGEIVALKLTHVYRVIS